MKVAIIGSYPPPFGGISVHVKRLADILEKNGVQVAVYDVDNTSESGDARLKRIACGELWVLKYLFTMDEDIIHVHTHNWKYRAAMTFISQVRRKRIILTFHSLRDEIEGMGAIMAALAQYVFKNADVFITVGENEREKLEAWGCSKDKIRSISSFLPPGASDYALPGYVDEFMGRHDLIAAANGSNMDFYRGEDIYGLDMIVELCARVSQKYDVGFIYCISKGNLNNKGYYEHMKGIIREKGIDDRFIFVHENISMDAILKRADIFIRPTNTDSYGMSVAEAIYYCVPAIASDVCKRPKGSVLFKSRDMEDLYEKTVDVIENIGEHRRSIEHVAAEDNGEAIVQVYKNLRGD